MIRIAIGKYGLISSISEDGKPLPANKASIYMSMKDSTKITLEGLEVFSPTDIREYWRTIDMSQEEVQLEVVS